MPSATQCITRKGKVWYNTNGKILSNVKAINKIAIPPAYTNVCVNPKRSAKLQATAVDAKGKTHYYYHASFLEQQKKNRQNRVKRMNGKAILRSTARILDNNKKDKEWYAAAALRLIALTGIRSGDPKYFKQNGSVGAMTLRPKHVKLKGGGGIQLEFPGKSNVQHEILIQDRRLQRVLSDIKRTRAEQPLFGVSRNAILSILRKHGHDLQLKDLRTLLANKLYRAYLDKIRRKYPSMNSSQVEKVAVKKTANNIGHSATVCKKYYLFSNNKT
jgi:DNA topoisomerase I